MDSRELRILKEIEAQTHEEDADFAERIAYGPRLPIRYKLGIGLGIAAGFALLLSFSSGLLFGLAGYLVLVVVGTNLLRRRAIKPAEESPLEIFHRLTAGLFRNTSYSVGASLDFD